MKKERYLACIWPRADWKKNKEKILKHFEGCKIVDEIEHYFKFRAFKYFIYQIYHMHPWVGNAYNHYFGSARKAYNCYKKNNPCYFIAFEAGDLEEVLEIKSRIRKELGLDNHSIHITDDSAETIEIERIIRSNNSITFINEGRPDKYPTIEKKVKAFNKLTEKKGISVYDYAFDSSVILGLWGLRRPRDIDFLTVNEECKLLNTDYSDCHNDCGYYLKTIEELVNDDVNYFWWNGNKYIYKDVVRDMKNKRGERKDKKDVFLFEKCINPGLKYFFQKLIINIENDIKLFARYIIRDLLGIKRK